MYLLFFYYYLIHIILSSRLLSRNLKVKICKTVILPLLCGSETWSLTLREEQGLEVFENGVKRRIFGPSREGVTGGWKKLHTQQLHNLYRSLNRPIIRTIKYRGMRLLGFVAHVKDDMHTKFWSESLKGRVPWKT
jgi:hypothetical protein